MDPIVTSFEPKTGPSIGGTQMIINGIGFTPRKDANGNADLKKNHMWIRFVDPDTFEVLAPQIKTEDVSEDQIIWSTPPLPANTKALMQLSING